MAAAYSPADLKALRNRQPVSGAFADSMVKDILNVTAQHFRNAGASRCGDRRRPLFLSFFAMRSPLHALALRWIADGGIQSTAPAKLTNDFVDQIFGLRHVLRRPHHARQKPARGPTSSRAGFCGTCMESPLVSLREHLPRSLSTPPSHNSNIPSVERSCL